MSNGQPTITVSTQPKTVRPPRKKRARARNQGGKTVQVQILSQGGKSRRTKKRDRLTLAANEDRSMVPVPRDTRTLQGSSNAKQTTLKTIMSFARQTIAPHTVGEVVRAPCLVNFKNHCTKFNKVVNLSIPASGSINGRFVPQPHFIEIANTADYPSTATGLDYVATIVPNGVLNGKGRAKVVTGEVPTVQGIIDSVPVAPSYGGSPQYWLPVAIPVGGTLVIEDTSPSIPSQVWSYDPDTDTMDTLSAVGTEFTATTPGKWISFTFPLFAQEPLTVFFSTDDTVKIPAGMMYSPNPIALPDDVQTLRTSLLSGLVSYTGSSLENQGNIVMALTDPDWYQTTSDLYNELSKLPDKRFNGPLKRGAYGWWSPAVIDEEVPQSTAWYDRLPNTSALRFAIASGAEGQSIKVEGQIGIEFYSPEQVFAHVPCIPKSPIYGHLYHLFNTLPHVMPNEEHDDMCKDLIGKVTKTVNAAVSNPAALTLGVLALV